MLTPSQIQPQDTYTSSYLSKKKDRGVIVLAKVKKK